MVRTDSKARAEELERIYADSTKLNLRRVDSSYSLRYIRKTIDALKNKELDGIIAVDMLGEGFDFPNLKIAAVHSPHKSLAATLQFIGRFARTNAKGIGQAKFVAVVQEIKGSIQELYEEGAEWQEIVPMLNDDRVQDEMETRTVLRDFRQDERFPVDDETKDLSLYGIRPYSHVKIYRVAPDLDITRDIQMVQGLEVKHREVSEDGTTVVFLTKEEVQPKWAPRGRFIKVEYDLFIIHIERDTGLVFICTSRRRELVYRHLIAQYAGDDHDILAVEVINRVLNDIDNPEAFSVGMRSRMQASAESYRIMAGPNAAKAIKRTDGRMYHRGHGMFRGQEGGDNITIGLSSASKVWANGYLQIPHLLRWCKHVATKLANEKTSRTNSNWDFLPMPERISVLPDQPAIAVDWDKDVYLEQPFLHIANGDGVEEIPLLDCDITVDPEQTAGVIRFRVELGDRAWPLEFALTPAATISAAGWDEAGGPMVEWEGEEVTLSQFLCTSFPTFYFPDFSLLTGRDYLRAVTEGLVFDGQQIEVVDWNTAKVDIRAERHNPQAGTVSIHDYLRDRLAKQGHTVVVYDDGSGEVADFVAIDDRDAEVHFTFHHAKGSKGAKPGERVGDVYEVCGQAVKSLRWTAAPPALVDRLLLRSRDRDAERIVVGSRDALKEVRESVAKKKVSYHIVVVQPGISRAALTSNTSALPLASADFFITQAGNFDDLLVIGSA
jgi:hypothetical protein